MIGVGFKDAARVQESFIAPLERRALNYLAGRMPDWVKPDHLTLLGFASLLMAGVFYAMARQWPEALLLVNLCIVINWFGDSLDGTLARKRNRQRPRYGYYVDHMVDTFGAVAISCGLALSGYMSERIATAALIAYLVLSINVFLAAHAMGIFRLSFWKFSPTEARMLLCVGNTYVYFKPMVGVLGERHLLYDVAGAVAAIVMLAMALASAALNIAELYRQEKY